MENDSSFLATLYLFAPAFIANAAPVVLLAIPFLRRNNAPAWETAFGKHKTRIGFAGGTLIGVIVSVLQFVLRDQPALASITILHDTLPQSIFVGFLLGFGALIGDAIESLIKRRIGIPPGGALPFFDGIDHIVGALVFLAPVYLPPLSHIVILLLISPLLSLAANTFSYVVGWKKTWY